MKTITTTPNQLGTVTKQAITDASKIIAKAQKEAFKNLEFPTRSGEVSLSIQTTGLETLSTTLEDYLDIFDRLDLQALIQPLNDAINRTLVAYGLVDTGTLKNSLVVVREGTSISIRYEVPYAGLMHEGGYITPYGNPAANKVYIAPRPWIIDTLNEFDFQPYIDDIVQQALTRT